jgi:hypothetical protein
MYLAGNVCLGSLTLGIQRIKLLLETLFGGFSRINGGSDGPGTWTNVGSRVVHFPPPSLKKRNPLQCEAVIFSATAVSDG